MRWLGKGGLGLLNRDLVLPGGDIPEGGLTSDRIDELATKGLIDLGEPPKPKRKRRKKNVQK